MKHRKLKAFTIMELMVALVLTALVIAVAFTVFSLSTKQFTLLTKRFEVDNEYTLLQYTLQLDMQHADYLSLNENGFKCVNNNDQINYLLLDSIILRQHLSGTVDSFYFKIDSVSLNFEKRYQPAIDGLIDEVHLTLGRDERAFIIHQRKHYDAKTLFN